ncbi:MAG TPA: DNA polymerase III subunit gamma/tau, partial [Candidatus Obscuribacterales bacterium]
MPQTYQPLYLKYRPQSLNDLVGQHSVATTLTNAIEHDRISHAYLFTGPRGCGKTSSARIMAKSLNCDKGPTAVPCQECTACIEIRQVNSPSVIEIDAASNNSVDDARTLIERAPLVSAGGRYKLYIIDECHMLTKEAFNALLKTIEEPPPKVIFILATTEEHKVPPTIVSRCQRLMFRLINHKELARYLRKVADQEQISIDDAAVELIARRSGGGLRDALGLLDQASLLASPDKPIALNDLLTLLGSVHEDALLSISQAMSDRNGQSVLEEASKLLTEGREPALIALELAKHFLNLAKASYASDAEMSADALDNALILGSPTYLAQLRQQAPNFDATELAQMVEQLDRLEQSCRRSSQPALTLEIGLLSLCHRLEITELRQLKARLEALESRFATEGGGRPPQIDTRRPQSSPAAAHPPAGPAAAHPPASPAAAHPPAS